DQPVRLIICGSPGVGKRTLARALTGGSIVGSGLTVDVCDMPDDVAVALPNADVYVYVVGANSPLGALQRDHLGQLARRPGAVICALNSHVTNEESDSSHIEKSSSEVLGLTTEGLVSFNALDRSTVEGDLASAVLRAAPHLALPLGRQLPALREAAAEQLIAEASRANAEFVVISSVPGMFPILGPLAAAGADVVVLTKNQVMLILKLALLYQRTIDHRLQVLAEVTPVIGAAFFWRSAARFAASFLPGPIAIAPRGLIAYVGTYMAGKSGQYYYRWGQRPSSEVLDRFGQEAVNQVNTVMPQLGRIARRLRFL
ncbi:MAG TPA: hypothetical protein VMW65_14945, partial [Chloroflexota bacterium]|nr:hypothetical protein [Chloroflexota bacterium]